jgi:hypothetical protein
MSRDARLRASDGARVPQKKESFSSVLSWTAGWSAKGGSFLLGTNAPTRPRQLQSSRSQSSLKSQKPAPTSRDKKKSSASGVPGARKTAFLPDTPNLAERSSNQARQHKHSHSARSVEPKPAKDEIRTGKYGGHDKTNEPTVTWVGDCSEPSSKLLDESYPEESPR